jgi:hypothetical protein
MMTSLSLVIVLNITLDNFIFNKCIVHIILWSGSYSYSILIVRTLTLIQKNKDTKMQIEKHKFGYKVRPIWSMSLTTIE